VWGSLMRTLGEIAVEIKNKNGPKLDRGRCYAVMKPP
jgi:hypothetical protein